MRWCNKIDKYPVCSYETCLSPMSHAYICISLGGIGGVFLARKSFRLISSSPSCTVFAMCLAFVWFVGLHPYLVYKCNKNAPLLPCLWWCEVSWEAMNALNWSHLGWHDGALIGHHIYMTEQSHGSFTWRIKSVTYRYVTINYVKSSFMTLYLHKKHLQDGSLV